MQSSIGYHFSLLTRFLSQDFFNSSGLIFSRYYLLLSYLLQAFFFRNGWVIFLKCIVMGIDHCNYTLIFNEESLVNSSHQLVLITSLPFVHTARRSYRLSDPVNNSD